MIILLGFFKYFLKIKKIIFRSTDGVRQDLTWIHEIFQGTLTNETRCLNCETVSSKDEDFLDLSVDIEQVFFNYIFH